MKARWHLCLVIVGVANAAIGMGIWGQDVAPASKIQKVEPWVDVEYAKSEMLAGIEFDEKTRRTEARGSDIWPITWADDGHQRWEDVHAGV